MARWLKLNTATTIQIGPFLDSVDGNTEKTALAMTATQVSISKNGSPMAVVTTTATLPGGTLGWYQLALATTELNTIGPFSLYVHPATSLPVWEHFMVVSQNTYDGLIATATQIFVNAIQVSSATPQTATQIAEAVRDIGLLGTGTATSLGAAIVQTNGLVSTNLDAKISVIPDATVIKDSCRLAIDDKLTNIATAVWTTVLEGAHTCIGALRCIASFSYANLTAGPNPVFRDLDNTKDRFRGTADSAGNRTRTYLDET